MHTPLHIPNTPRLTLRIILGGLIGLLLISAIVGYVGYQARFLIAGPQISLTDSPPPTTASSTIRFSGSTENITRLWLNGRQIFTNQEGHFTELVALTPGVNIITVTAMDRYSRTTQAVQTVVQTN